MLYGLTCRHHIIQKKQGLMLPDIFFCKKGLMLSDNSFQQVPKIHHLVTFT